MNIKTLLIPWLAVCPAAYAVGDLASRAAVATDYDPGLHDRLNTLDMAQLIQGVILVSLAVYTFLSNRHQATQDRVDGVEQRLAEKLEAHAQRISRLEQAISSLATHRDLNALTTTVAAASAQMESLLESQRVMRDHLESSLRPLSRMQDMLTQQQLDLSATSKRPTARRRTT